MIRPDSKYQEVQCCGCGEKIGYAESNPLIPIVCDFCCDLEDEDSDEEDLD